MSLLLNDARKAKTYFEDKLAYTTGPITLKHWLDAGENVTVLDLRDAESFADGHIPGALHFPKDRWNDLSALKKDQVNVVYCYSQSCHLAAAGAVALAEKGYSVVEMEGGFDAWKDMQLPVESAAVPA